MRVTYRLRAPGSEWRLHRDWFARTALADLLGGDFGLAEIHKLYATLDHALPLKNKLLDQLQLELPAQPPPKITAAPPLP